jgi:hypothetical protein
MSGILITITEQAISTGRTAFTVHLQGIYKLEQKHC